VSGRSPIRWIWYGAPYIFALIDHTYSSAYDTGFSDGLGSIIGATRIIYQLPAGVARAFECPP
jgi:hypothetical protein